MVNIHSQSAGLNKVKRYNVAGLDLLGGVGQICVFTPRRGRYAFGKSEKRLVVPPRPLLALSSEPQTNQALIISNYPGGLTRWLGEAPGTNMHGIMVAS